MPSKFIIEGGKPLGGEIVIRGSKNAALPLIAASLLTAEPVILENVPAIDDVATMVAIAEKLGAAAHWEREAHRLTLQAKALTSDSPDEALSRKLRGSILFAGALLGRVRRVIMSYPGGDAIGARPLATHFHALEAMGVRIQEAERIALDGAGLRGETLTLEEPSVTATETAMLAAVLAPGKTVLRLAAVEPHVQELAKLLRNMGANISWSGFSQLTISGVPKLSGAAYRINPDELEVSGFVALAAASRSEITIRDVEPEYLDAVFLQLKKMGVAFEPDGRALKILKPRAGYKSFRLQSGLYPKLGSDHLPPFAVLATQAEGTSLIHDWLYENRLRYIPELQKLGADCIILDPHRALVTGPTPLVGGRLAGCDIRSGMTLIIAALVAKGQSVISDIEHIDRGYEKIEARLQALGADITRVNE